MIRQLQIHQHSTINININNERNNNNNDNNRMRKNKFKDKIVDCYYIIKNFFKKYFTLTLLILIIILSVIYEKNINSIEYRYPLSIHNIDEFNTITTSSLLLTTETKTTIVKIPTTLTKEISSIIENESNMDLFVNQMNKKFQLKSNIYGPIQSDPNKLVKPFNITSLILVFLMFTA
ncbi:hypothetical protein C6P40_003776, partial [Pichia californica]